MKISVAIVVLIGLAAGNSFYQSMQDTPNWGAAFERSFFQACAILCFALALYVSERVNKP